MIKPLLFQAVLFLLCVNILHAHVATTYSPGATIAPGNATATMAKPQPVLNACDVINSEGYESSFGIWIDGGSNCARSNSFPKTGSWSVELRAGVGLTSAMYTGPQNYTGVGVTLDFSFYPVGYETGEGLVLEYATDASGTFTGFTAWVAGTHFQNNTRYNVSVPMNSVTWTNTSRLRLRSVASATDDRVYIDDVVISNCCDVGAPCNDGSQCTTGDVINANCQCAGTWQDADSDGTCDAFDMCPGVDDYLIISEAPCDDGDPCTEGDHMDLDVCGCQGQYIDWDQDGLCANDDPNDLDACNPDPQNPACNPCTTHSNAHFESNFQIWNSGGNDCDRVYAPQYAAAGNYCVRIQDNSGAPSSMYTSNMSLAGLNNLSVAFSFIAVSMEANEDFILEASTNGGSSYTFVDSWSSGSDFQNNTRYWINVPVTGFTWTNQTRFRIRCDASANDDRVYLDDIIIKTCLNYPAFQAPEVVVQPDVSNHVPAIYTHPDEIILSPNPVTADLQIDGMQLDNATIDIVSVAGSMIRNFSLDGNAVDVSQLQPGLYFLRIEKEGQLIVKRFVKE